MSITALVVHRHPRENQAASLFSQKLFYSKTHQFNQNWCVREEVTAKLNIALGCTEILKLIETKLLRQVKILNVIRQKCQLFVNPMVKLSSSNPLFQSIKAVT